MGTKNRRQHTRVGFQTVVDLWFPDRGYDSCLTKDLSMQGVFICGAHDRKVGETCEVSLHLTGGSSDLLVMIKAEVVRVEPQGIALKFFETDIDSFAHLKNIIYYNSEDPDRLDEEWSGPSFTSGR